MKIILVITLTLLLSLTGCRSEEVNEEKNSKIEVNGKEFLLPNIEETLNSDEKYKIGDSFSVFDHENGERIFTVENCRIFNDFKETGLDVNLLNTNFISKPEILVNESFVLLDIKIENISSQGFIDGCFYMNEMMVGDTYEIKNNIDNEIAYFSEAPQQTENSKNYGMYEIDIGNTLRFEAGWFLDRQSIKNKDYLLQIGLSNSDYQYVKLIGEN